MPLTLGTNLRSIQVQTDLDKTNDALSNIFERLSSGLRINKASDDPAGYISATSTKARATVISQGIRNINDSISLVSLADSSIDQLKNIVSRMSELAEQAANGTLSHSQRLSLDTEAQALGKEFSRISRSTKFNDKELFAASFGSLRTQDGFGINGGFDSNLGGKIGLGTFSAGATYSTEASSSLDTKLVDVNGDGNLDILTAGQFNVGLRLGDGSGSFGSYITVTVGALNNIKLQTGDLNGDRILDVMSAGYDGGAAGVVSISLGIGDGTFKTSTTYATVGTGPSFAADLGDINGDGIQDLVAGGSSAGTSHLSIRLGNGDGTFLAATTYSEATGAIRAIEIIDLNGDGNSDIVSAGNASGAGYTNIRLGTGNGSFGTATSYAAESTMSRSVEINDINNDGKLDLVTAGLAGADGYASIRLGVGDGTFGSIVSVSTESGNSRDVESYDFNGDGNLDLITAGVNDANDGYITIRLGNGNGTFKSPTSYLADSKVSTSLSIGDINKDGVPDVVSAGQTDGSIGSTSTFLSTTTTGLQPILEFSLTTTMDAKQALSTFNQKLDLLSEQQGQIGSFLSRLDTALEVARGATENLFSAYSRIMDADIASEVAEMTKLSILQQAGTALLAQANQDSSLVLNLLD